MIRTENSFITENGTETYKGRIYDDGELVFETEDMDEMKSKLLEIATKKLKCVLSKDDDGECACGDTCKDEKEPDHRFTCDDDYDYDDLAEFLESLKAENCDKQDYEPEHNVFGVVVNVPSWNIVKIAAAAVGLLAAGHILKRRRA